MIHEFEVRMIVRIEDLEDEDNSRAAKLRDLKADIPRFFPYEVTDVTVTPRETLSLVKG